MPKGQPHPSHVRQVLGREESCKLAKTTTELKKTCGPGGVLGALGDKDQEVEKRVLAKLSETDDTHNRHGTATVSLEVEKAAIAEVAAGASPSAVAVKYSLQQNYVRHALQRRFGSAEAAKRALQGLVLENALACMVVAAQEIPKMNGPQAVMSGSLLIDKALALEKSIVEKPPVVNFAEMADMAKTLKVLREVTSGE